MATFGRSQDRANDALLDRAIRCLRETATVEVPEQLSPAIRAAVIEAAMNPAPAQPPQKAWFVAGFGAFFTVTVALLVLGGGGELSRPLTIQAAKAGSEVVFTISNGHRAHRIIKSTDVERLNAVAVTVEDGRFRDLAESGPVLVFYKID